MGSFPSRGPGLAEKGRETQELGHQRKYVSVWNHQGEEEERVARQAPCVCVCVGGGGGGQQLWKIPDRENHQQQDQEVQRIRCG